MKTRSVLLVGFILAAIFSFSMVGYIFGVTVAREENTPHNLTQVNRNSAQTEHSAMHTETDIAVINDFPKKEDVTQATQITYILREEKGEIALFKKSADGNETLHSSYDVPIIFLPKNDREALQKGIEFESMDEIAKFIEDYVG